MPKKSFQLEKKNENKEPRTKNCLSRTNIRDFFVSKRINKWIFYQLSVILFYRQFNLSINHCSSHLMSISFKTLKSLTVSDIHKLFSLFQQFLNIRPYLIWVNFRTKVSNYLPIFVYQKLCEIPWYFIDLVISTVFFILFLEHIITGL